MPPSDFPFFYILLMCAVAFLVLVQSAYCLYVFFGAKNRNQQADFSELGGFITSEDWEKLYRKAATKPTIKRYRGGNKLSRNLSEESLLSSRSPVEQRDFDPERIEVKRSLAVGKTRHQGRNRGTKRLKAVAASEPLVKATRIHTSNSLFRNDNLLPNPGHQSTSEEIILRETRGVQRVALSPPSPETLSRQFLKYKRPKVEDVYSKHTDRLSPTIRSSPLTLKSSLRFASESRKYGHTFSGSESDKLYLKSLQSSFRSPQRAPVRDIYILKPIARKTFHSSKERLTRTTKTSPSKPKDRMTRSSPTHTKAVKEVLKKSVHKRAAARFADESSEKVDHPKGEVKFAAEKEHSQSETKGALRPDPIATCQMLSTAYEELKTQNRTLRETVRCLSRCCRTRGHCRPASPLCKQPPTCYPASVRVCGPQCYPSSPVPVSPVCNFTPSYPSSRFPYREPLPKSQQNWFYLLPLPQ